MSSVHGTPLVTPSPSELGEGEAVGNEADLAPGKGGPPPRPQQGLTIAEDREEGAVSAGIWTLYLRQLGVGWVAAFTGLLVASQVSFIAFRLFDLIG
jgi:hypothetical protein